MLFRFMDGSLIHEHFTDHPSVKMVAAKSKENCSGGEHIPLLASLSFFFFLGIMPDYGHQGENVTVVF